MKVQRSHITDIEKRFEFNPTGEELDIPELHDKARVTVNIYSMGENYFCHGDLQAELDLRCDICLVDFLHTVKNEYEAYIKLEDSEEPGGSEDSDVLRLRKNDIHIDLTDFIHDIVLLEIPIQKRCRPDCKGLCSVCGANLNNGECDHENESIDPRWAALEKLKKNIN